MLTFTPNESKKLKKDFHVIKLEQRVVKVKKEDVYVRSNLKSQSSDDRCYTYLHVMWTKSNQ